MVHLILESLALLTMFGLWLASGFGWWIRPPYFERIHYDLVQVYPDGDHPRGPPGARLRIRTVGPTPDAYPGPPLLVFSRHAGPGDSFTLIYALMHWYHREPRIVLKDTMAGTPRSGCVPPPAEPVHLAPPGAGAGPGSPRWANLPATSTRTTRS